MHTFMPLDAFLFALLVKAAATALVVVAASVAAEKSGPFWGGLISCLPVAAGPGYVMLGLAQSPAFIADSALASLAAGVATWMYICTFVRLAQRWTLWPSLAGALGVWLVLAVLIRVIPWSLTAAIVGNAIAFSIALRFTPKMAINPATASLPRPWHELPKRALLVGLFVALVVTVADAIGPEATGIAAVFPIALSSLTVVVHGRFGIRGSAAGLASAVKPLIGIACGLLAVHLAVPSWGIWPGLGVGVAASLAWLVLLIAFSSAKSRRNA